MMTTGAENVNIRLTEAAVTRMRELVTGENRTGLRLAVKAAGCSGLEYVLEFADAPQSGDYILFLNGFSLYVDAESYAKALAGLTVDFQRDALSSGFVYINPNKKGECGCGISFSV